MIYVEALSPLEDASEEFPQYRDNQTSSGVGFTLSA